MSTRFPKREWTGPYVGWGSLDGNHHGPRGANGDAETLRSTAQVVFLDNGMNPPPRYYWGIRLWIYAPSGRCWSFDLAWRSSRRYAASEVERQRRADLYVEQQKARSEWPPKYDGSSSFFGAMLGASGLGLRMRGE